jgi:hypothetical protein
MTRAAKLPKRVTINGNPYIVEQKADGTPRLVDDVKAIMAKKPACARYTKNEAKPTSRRKADSVKKVDHG